MHGRRLLVIGIIAAAAAPADADGALARDVLVATSDAATASSPGAFRIVKVARDGTITELHAAAKAAPRMVWLDARTLAVVETTRKATTVTYFVDGVPAPSRTKVLPNTLWPKLLSDGDDHLVVTTGGELWIARLERGTSPDHARYIKVATRDELVGTPPIDVDPLRTDWLGPPDPGAATEEAREALPLVHPQGPTEIAISLRTVRQGKKSHKGFSCTTRGTLGKSKSTYPSSTSKLSVDRIEWLSKSTPLYAALGTTDDGNPGIAVFLGCGEPVASALSLGLDDFAIRPASSRTWTLHASGSALTTFTADTLTVSPQL